MLRDIDYARQSLEQHFCYQIIKRLVDIAVAVIGLLLLSVPFFIICIAIKIETPGPAFFRQLRMGRGAKPFYCYKFRTMLISAPKNCSAAKLNNRKAVVTRVGGFLRKSSIDELPQLLNVLKGDMSLVGPRPLILNETWINEEREKLGIYLLRPGITGLAQICGRNHISDTDKLYFDKYYLTNFSIWLDMKIVFGTFLYVLQQKDIL